MCPPGHHSNHARGEEHCRARLTEEAVEIIRSTDGETKQLAEQFGVSDRLVRYVRQGRIWRHL
jgi:hypothetical protein